MSTTSSPPPFVHYYCACPDLNTNNTAQDPRRLPEESTSSKKDLDSLDEKAATTPTSSTTSQQSQHQHRDQLKDQTSIDASATGRHLLSTQASNYLYPLSRLYFCEDCHQIRCPSCVQDEIVSYYCPNCLFEVIKVVILNVYIYIYNMLIFFFFIYFQVPTASVKSEKNR